MRLRFLVLILISMAIQTPPTANGTIEGRVLKAGTGEPIANTPVTLISSAGLSDTALTGLLDQMSQLVTAGLQGQGGGGSQDLTIRQVTNLLQSAGPNVRTQASVLTDRAGHFAFSELPPGRYTVWVQRFNYFGPLQNGFLSSTVSSTITLDGARSVPPLDLFLTQGMAITGRVVDSLGQPAIGMAITAFRSTYTEGRQVWLPVVSRQIDDRGEYRLSPLPPGDYYVGVTPPSNIAAPAGQYPPVRTFFPGVTDPAQATRLTLKNGDIARVDISLRTAPASFFRITGFAVNPVPFRSPAGIVDNGFSSFILVPVESNIIDGLSPNTFMNAVSAENRAAGEFEIRNVRPGIYELYPVVPNSVFPAGRTVVDVRSSDVAGVRVVVNPVVTMQGKVTVANGIPQKPVNLDAVRVVLLPWIAPSIFRSSVSLPVDDGGGFEVRGPAGALINLQVDGLPDTAYVSDVRVGTNSFPGGGFGLSSTEQVQVLIDAANGATVDATVQTSNGVPAARARIALVPSEDQRQNPSRYKVGTADNAGRVVFHGIAPGSYTAFAWESIPDTAWLNKEFLSKYQDLGTPAMLLPGAQLKLQLKSIPFDTEQH